ncbi:MAG: CotH kinase family protein [Butyrivibrio sp.]|nr:CotH kinase family protein [Butyrivibrio sp.]
MKYKLIAFILSAIVMASVVVGNYYKQDEVIIEETTEVEHFIKPDTDYLKTKGLSVFETNLPIIYINTNDQEIVKNSKVPVYMQITNNEGNEEFNLISNIPDEEYSCLINYRGASSYSQFDKKQYRINFIKNIDSDKEINVPFMGMGEDSSWVLNGPYLDKTLMRNKLMYDLGKEILAWSSDSRYCELFIDGKYQGVYLAIEPISNGTCRLRLSKFGLLSGATSFIVKRDRVGTELDALDNFGTIAGKTVNELYLTYPSPAKVTDSEQKWVENRISNFEKALYSDNYIKSGDYRNYIDVNNFVDYYILNEFAMNHDAGNLSTYVYAELNGQMLLAIWDFNNGFDNYQWFRSDISELFLAENAWFDRLVQDPYFMDKVRKRYTELRQSTLSDENIAQHLEEYQNTLGDAIDRNFGVWGYSFYIDMLTNSDSVRRTHITSYEIAVNQLEDTIERRLKFLDKEFATE